MLPKEPPFTSPFTRKSALYHFTWRELIPLSCGLQPTLTTLRTLLSSSHRSLPSHASMWKCLPYSPPPRVISTVEIAGHVIHRAPATVRVVLLSSLRGVRTKQLPPDLLSPFLNICSQTRKQDPGYERCQCCMEWWGVKLPSNMPTTVVCSCQVWMKAVLLYFVLWPWHGFSCSQVGHSPTELQMWGGL